MLLPSNLDFAAAKPLWLELQQRRGGALVLDASAVERVGGLCLQLLLAAAAEWSAAGLEFRIASASQPFANAMQTMGAKLDYALSEAG